MVRYLVQKLKKYHAREVIAENLNCPNGKAKPDIHVIKNGTVYYIDVGFSNDAHAYYNKKDENYKKETKEKVDMLIF